MDAMSPDDDGLWDELSNEQSREIQRHQQATRRSHTIAAVRNVVQQTANAISSVATTAAANMRNSYQTVPTTNQNLSDFGLSYDEESQQRRQDPLLEKTTTYGYQPPPMQQQRQQEGTRNLHDTTNINITDVNADNTQQTNHRESNFVFLQNFRLLPKRDGWGAVANLDLFFAALYNYYYQGGLYPIISKGVVELVSLFFTLWLSVLLFAYLDWKALSKCIDETSCQADLNSYMIHKPFARVSLWNLIVILYCLLFVCYGAFSVWSFLHTLRDAYESKYFFEQVLGISSRRLEGGAVEWDRDVITKMLELQESGEYRIAISGQGHLDALVVAQRILRKENFLVAFFNLPLLDLTVPFHTSRMSFCKSLEWSLYFCVLNYMFNHKYQIRPAFYLDPQSLRRRFVICGVAHAIFMPFLLFFMTLHFSLLNIYDWKSTKLNLGPREWSLAAKWTMREFNELPHHFEHRLGPSYEAGSNYLKLFSQNPIMTAVAKIMVLVGGSLGAVLLVFAAINDAILLHVKIGDWNLLWYVGILGVVYSCGKSMLPDPSIQSNKHARNLFAEMDEALAKVTTHTHHYPDRWKGRGYRTQTYKEFSAMFKYKAHLFLQEIVSVILAPIVLCFSLPKCAEMICEFVLQTKTEVPGAGDVCGFATFDFDSFQDENWEGRTMGNQSQHATTAGAASTTNMTGSVMASAFLTQSVEAARALHPKPKARQGKMEKSFFSFKAAHPTWKCGESGQHLVDRVEQYQINETMALARERQWHIEAAARQLETLTQLERKRLESSLTASATPQAVKQVDTSYIARMPRRPNTIGGGADSGGGGAEAATHPPEPVSPPTSARDENEVSKATATPGPTENATPTDVASSEHPAARSVHFDELKAPAVKPHAVVFPPPPFAATPEQQAAPPATVGAASSTAPLAARMNSSSMQAPNASVLHYNDANLSAELRRFLNRSTLEADISAAGSVLGGASMMHGTLASMLTDNTEDIDRTTERQYLWLERYHSYLAEQRTHQQQNRQEAVPNRGADLSASDNAVIRDASKRSPEGSGRGLGLGKSSIL